MSTEFHGPDGWKCSPRAYFINDITLGNSLRAGGFGALSDVIGCNLAVSDGSVVDKRAIVRHATNSLSCRGPHAKLFP